MRRSTDLCPRLLRLAGPALILTFALTVPANTLAADAAWSETAVAEARAQLVDLLASEEIDRLDFRAPTYDDAIALIRTTADEALDRTREGFATPERAALFLDTVTRALDDHEPRGLSMTFLEKLTIPVTDADSAALLGEVLATAAVIIRDHLGGEAPMASVSSTADALFRTPALDAEEGLTYLQQYHDELMRIASLPPADRVRYLEE